MKAGLTIQELAAELQRQQDAKQDYIANTAALEFKPTDEGDVRLFGLPDGDMGVNQIAHSQFASRLGIPKPYYDRMRSDFPDLLSKNLNGWMHQEPATRYVRTLDGNVRAFLSDRYRPLDNPDVVEAILPALLQHGGEIESCNVSERKLYVKLVKPDLTELILKPGAEMGVGHDQYDKIEAGLVLQNSEVGMGTLGVSPALHTRGCTNLAVMREDSATRTHLGKMLGGGDDSETVRRFVSDETRRKQDAAIFSTVRDVASAALDGRLFNQYVEQVKVQRGLKIEGEVPKVVERVANRLSLTQSESDGILDALIKSGDTTAYGLQNAVTRYSQDVDDYDRATDMERAGGELITLPQSEWKRLLGAEQPAQN